MWVLAVTKGEEPYLQDKSDIVHGLNHSFNMPGFPTVDHIFRKGSHVPDLIALVKWSW